MTLGVRSGRKPLRALAALLVLSLPLANCRDKAHARRHAAVEAPPPAAPTPDNTPIDVLRTPSGMVLKLEETPAPSATPMPAGSPSVKP